MFSYAECSLSEEESEEEYDQKKMACKPKTSPGTSTSYAEYYTFEGHTIRRRWQMDIIPDDNDDAEAFIEY